MKNSGGIQFPVIKYAPVLCSWNADIQNRIHLPDILRFLCSDFFLYFCFCFPLGVIQNIKRYRMPFLLYFRKNAVFCILTCFDTYIML